MKVSSIKNWLQNNVEVCFAYNHTHTFGKNLFYKKKKGKILKTSRLLIKYNPKLFTFIRCHLCDLSSNYDSVYAHATRGRVYMQVCVHAPGLDNAPAVTRRLCR